MRIVNLNNRPEPPWIYVGRFMGGKRPREASPLGNPFKVKEHGLDALRLYRQWLFDKIRANDKQIMFLLTQAINEDAVLACYCVDLTGEEIFTEPERCHAQIICKAYRWLKQHGAS